MESNRLNEPPSFPSYSSSGSGGTGTAAGGAPSASMAAAAPAPESGLDSVFVCSVCLSSSLARWTPLLVLLLQVKGAKALTFSFAKAPWWTGFLCVCLLIILVLIFMRILMVMSTRWGKMMQARVNAAIKARLTIKDQFRKENGYSWDYCFVFKVTRLSDTLTERQEKFGLKTIVQRMANAGLQTRLFYSIQNDEVYCKARVPLSRLCKEAERIEMCLQLEPASVANLLREGNRKGPKETHWGPITIPTQSIETDIGPYEFIYAPFLQEMAEKRLYKTVPGSASDQGFLRSVDRLKLINSIISARFEDGGCQLDVYRLIKENCIVGCFAIHDSVELRTLESKWLTFFERPSLQRTDMVRDYFGEKVAFYFVFLAHYTSWLFWAAIVGVCAWINVAYENNNPDAVLIPYFAAFMAIWSTLFLESWKRHQSLVAMQWGMTDHELSEAPRPEFTSDGSVIKTLSAVDGSRDYFFPYRENLRRKIFSLSASAFFVMLVIAAVIGMFVAKFVMGSTRGLESYSGILASLLNAVQIQVMGALYSFVSLWLTKYENHRTETQYEDSLILKSFVVSFINSFSSMFFIAFGQPFLADAIEIVPWCPGGCMNVLQQTMGVLFLTNLIVGSLAAITVPYVQRRMREKAEFEDVADKNAVSQLEHEFLLNDYHVVNGSFQDYSATVLQFAFATMFVSAFPLALLLALVNNYVLQRLNAWKFCQLSRRPEPRNQEDIGSWYLILEVVSYMAVFVSSGLVAFTGKIAINSTWTARAWIFFGMSAGIIVVKLFVQVIIPDVSRRIVVQLERQKYIVDKLFEDIPDEVEAEYRPTPEALLKTNCDIRINDDDPL